MRTLLFFLSVACTTAYTDLRLTDYDGNYLPSQTGKTYEETLAVGHGTINTRAVSRLEREPKPNRQFTFTAQEPACPQSGLALSPMSKQDVKLSVAEVFVSLIEQEPHFSIEPQVLESLRFRLKQGLSPDVTEAQHVNEKTNK